MCLKKGQFKNKKAVSGRKKQKADILISTPTKEAHKRKYDALSAKKMITLGASPCSSNLKKKRKTRGKTSNFKPKENLR